MSTSQVSGRQRQRSEGDFQAWKIRPMSQEDIAKCLEIWLKVELTEAYQTVASALATDPAGFYVAEIDGQVIGMCAGPMTRDDTAFMGFYAVEPRYQGIGVGRELWAKTLERLGESQNIGLYGVPAMSAKYKKSGFKVEDSIRMLIYESTFTTDESGKQKHQLFPERLSSLEGGDLKISSSNDNRWLLVGKHEMENLNEADLFEQLVNYDESVNTFSRRNLLANYVIGNDVPLTVILLMPKQQKQPHQQQRQLAQSNAALCCHEDDNSGPTTTTRAHNESQSGSQSHKSLGCEQSQLKKTVTGKGSESEDETLSSSVQLSLSISSTTSKRDSCEHQIQIVGYGCVRHDNTGGGMIGPLYADSDYFCEIILRQLMKHFPMQLGGKYSVMSLTSNNSASRILEKIGLKQMDQCSRMFTQFVPEASLAKIYYIHSPNFTLF